MLVDFLESIKLSSLNIIIIIIKLISPILKVVDETIVIMILYLFI